MQDNGYRLIKLKNGDSLIAKVLEIRKKTLVVERPMQFKTVVLVDQNQMTNTEMVVFKAWIDYTLDRVIEIAADGALLTDVKIILPLATKLSNTALIIVIITASKAYVVI